MSAIHFCIISFSYGLGDVPNTCIYLNEIILAFLGVMGVFIPQS